MSSFIKSPITRTTERRRLQYSHGDEYFWQQLKHLQILYLPALSQLIENIEHVIKEEGNSDGIQEIRTRLGRLNSMLLNMYGIHKVHKKNEILISLENQIVQWIRAWETCGQNSHSGNTSSNSWTPSKMPSLTKSFPVMPPIQSLQQSPNFQKIAPLTYDQLNDLVQTFESFSISPINSENRSNNEERNLSHSVPVIDNFHRI